MDYEGQICRAPMERASFMLPVAVGCSYNRCRFCMLFKHLKYRELPVEQVEEELKRVKGVGGSPKKIECGLDDVLLAMDKDHSLQEVYEAIERIQAAGMIYDAHMMTGIAGKGRGMENAERMAEFYNRTRPGRIINFSLFIHRESPLYEDIAAGKFVPANELENLEEERRLLSILKGWDLEYDGFHDFIAYRVRGKLPKDRQKMLASLDGCIREYGRQEEIVAYVQDIKGSPAWIPPIGEIVGEVLDKRRRYWYD